jgi:hypothetical protein
MLTMIEEVKEVLKNHAFLKHAYFFNPGKIARDRTYNESLYNNIYKWNYNDTVYEVEMYYKELGNKCYYTVSIKENGIKKDMRAVKNLLKKLEGRV